MATLPTRLIEIEFDAGIWTDVSADVVSVATRRGRNKESGAFETGTMTVVLRNDGRKYDPDHASGPYYGKLRPNRRIRFRATYSLTFPIYQGYIDRITQVYGGPNDATAEIVASDLFKLLNRVELPVSVYMAEVMADAPKAFWRLDEPAGSTTVADSSGNNYTLDVNGAPVFGASGIVTRDPGTGVQLTSGAGQSIIRQYPLPVTGPPLTLEIMFRRTTAGQDGGMVGVSCNSITNGLFALLTSGTVVGVQAVNGANTQVFANTTGVNPDDLAIYHLVARWDATGALKLFVNGVDATSGSPTLATTAFTATTGYLFAAGGFGDPDTGVHQMAAIYNTALSNARIAAHNAAARTPWNGDTSGTRMSRILDLAAVPVGDTDINAGSTTLQATSLGADALSYAQKIEETEAGRLFVAADGKLTFLSRYNADIGTYLTSQTTLVDDDSGAGRPYRFVSADVDEARIVTRATVSREGSVALVYNDPTAQAEFKVINETHDGLLHNDDAYSLAYAQWIVNTHRTPATRVGTMELALPKDPANMYPDIFGLELGDRVTYKRKPQNTGAVFTQDMRVEAIEHQTGGHYWNTRLFLTPFGLGQGGWSVGVWDTSLWDQATWGL